jgi:hypothetical protein
MQYFIRTIKKISYLLLFTVVCSNAQKIVSGIVIDSENNMVIQYASIILKYPDATWLTGTFNDTNGYFCIECTECTDSVIVKIVALGYNALYIPLSNIDFLEGVFKLTPDRSVIFCPIPYRYMKKNKNAKKRKEK